MNKVTQSIYKNAVDKNLFDKNGNSKFIIGSGDVSIIPGMTVLSNKWCLNGNNLIFEFVGYFVSDVSANTLLTFFQLPQWILNKIVATPNNEISFISYNLTSTSHYESKNILFFKASNGVELRHFSPVIISSFGNEVPFFRVTCNMIIDSDSN